MLDCIGLFSTIIYWCQLCGCNFEKLKMKPKNLTYKFIHISVYAIVYALLYSISYSVIVFIEGISLTVFLICAIVACMACALVAHTVGAYVASAFIDSK